MPELNVIGLYGCLAVAELEPAVHWYARLVGREPDDRPMDGLVQWRNWGNAGIQLWQDKANAGTSRITIVVPDMAAERARLADQGLELSPDVQGDFGIIAQINDPAGNLLTLAEPPKGFVG